MSAVAVHSEDFHGDFAQSINREQRLEALINPLDGHDD